MQCTDINSSPGLEVRADERLSQTSVGTKLLAAAAALTLSIVTISQVISVPPEATAIATVSIA